MRLLVLVLVVITIADGAPLPPVVEVVPDTAPGAPVAVAVDVVPVHLVDAAVVVEPAEKLVSNPGVDNVSPPIEGNAPIAGSAASPGVATPLPAFVDGDTAVAWENQDADREADAKADFDEEYDRYLEELTQQMVANPAIRDQIIASHANRVDGDLDPVQKASLDIAKRLLGDEQSRTKLEEQQRAVIEQQRHVARERLLRAHGVNSRVDDFIDGERGPVLTPPNGKDPASHATDDAKRRHVMANINLKEHDVLRQREMERILAFRKALAEATPEQRSIMLQRDAAERAALHELRADEPGHAKQIKDVWAKDDGMDPVSFSPKIFFRLHGCDVSQDGFWDIKEIDALVLNEATRLHSVNGELQDRLAARAEMLRMREHILEEIDANRDMIISEQEFVVMAVSEKFQRDTDWKPIDPSDAISDDQLKAFEQQKAMARSKPGGSSIDHAAVLADYQARVAQHETRFGKVPHAGLPGDTAHAAAAAADPELQKLRQRIDEERAARFKDLHARRAAVPEPALVQSVILAEDPKSGGQASANDLAAPNENAAANDQAAVPALVVSAGSVEAPK